MAPANQEDMDLRLSGHIMEFGNRIKETSIRKWWKGCTHDRASGLLIVWHRSVYCEQCEAAKVPPNAHSASAALTSEAAKNFLHNLTASHALNPPPHIEVRESSKIRELYRILIEIPETEKDGRAAHKTRS